MAAVLLGCSDSASPGEGASAVRFRYSDGQADAFAVITDSALYRTAAYPTAGTQWYLSARAYLVPASTPIGVRTLSVYFDSIGGPQIAKGTYSIGAAPNFVAVYLFADDLRAVTDSGTITITTSDSTHISGTLNLYFTYYQYVSAPPPPFRLTGAFTFRNIGTTPLPLF